MPGFPPQLRSASRVVSKSDTKDASRSSGLQQNRGIMRFRFARFSPAKSFVSNLDIGSAVGAVSATARGRFPMRNPGRTWARHPTSLSRVVGPPAGPILCCAAGDIPCGRVQPAPGGGIRRRWGQESGPPPREMPPAGRKGPWPRRMSPSAARRRLGVYGQAQARGVRPGSGPRCVQAQARDVSSSGLRAPRFRLGRAARPGQLAHADSPRRAVGPAPGRCSPHAWPQHRRRPPVVRRSARSTAPAP